MAFSKGYINALTGANLTDDMLINPNTLTDPNSTAALAVPVDGAEDGSKFIDIPDLLPRVLRSNTLPLFLFWVAITAIYIVYPVLNTVLGPTIKV